MTNSDDEFLTTRELADLLRIKERKVYDMVNSGDVPCVRVVGKLLFPRLEVLQWISDSRSGPQSLTESLLPPTVLGSHDPLLDWALKESNSGLAALFDGSRDGLGRLHLREGVACGTHLHEPDGWNVNTIKENLGTQAVVLVEFAKRVRGLITPPGNPLGLSDIKSIAHCRVARRQDSAASQELFAQRLLEAGIAADGVLQCKQIARTEDELGMQVFDGEADVAFGLQSVAKRLRLDFVPLLDERFDLLVWRQAWFEPPFQRLLAFMRTDAFVKKAESLGGYDVSELGKVWFNG